MPRITLEKKMPIRNNIFEIKTYIYDLPENIVYKGRYLSYDNYHKEYTDRKDFAIRAVDYLNEMLKIDTKKKESDEEVDLDIN